MVVFRGHKFAFQSNGFLQAFTVTYIFLFCPIKILLIFLDMYTVIMQ